MACDDSMRPPGLRWLAGLRHPTSLFLVCALSAPAAAAQWDRLRPDAANFEELAASTNLIIEKWPKATQHYERLLARQPEHRWASWLLTRSLVEQGEHERALAHGAKAKPNPWARAPIAYELARAAAAGGDLARSVEYLEAARDAQLVMPAKVFRDDATLRALRKEPVWKELSKSVEEVAERFAALADAGDHQALVSLCRANAAMEWTEIPSTIWAVKDIVDEHSKAQDRKREKEAAVLAARLTRIAAAADEAFGNELVGTWIGEALAWSPEQRREDADLWERYEKLDRAIRGHRFTRVLETLEELGGDAEDLGDLPALYMVDRTRGLVHSAVLNYRQPRRGVSKEEEYQAGRAAFLRYRSIATKIQDVHGIVDAFDFLSTFEVQLPHASLAEAEQLVFGGIIASARVEPEARQLGMFEAIWRDLLAVER